MIVLPNGGISYVRAFLKVNIKSTRASPSNKPLNSLARTRIPGTAKQGQRRQTKTQTAANRLLPVDMIQTKSNSKV